LFIAGNLDETIGGPALPLHDEKNRRRTLYAAVSRAKPDAFLRLFDFPDPNETSEQRIATNVPIQQLFFLNSDFVRSQAELLAKRIGMSKPEPQRIEDVYMILFGRTPTQRELQFGSQFVASQENSWTEYLEVLLSSIEFSYIG
jgi:hypothetical protein